MKTYDEISQSIDKDSKINNLDLEGEILRTPILMAKYMKWHYEYKVALGKGESMMNQLVCAQMRFYQGKGDVADYKRKQFNDTVNNLKDMERYLNADEDICDLSEKIVAFESVRDTISVMIDNLKYRNNSIATIIELRKFESGA